MLRFWSLPKGGQEAALNVRFSVILKRTPAADAAASLSARGETTVVSSHRKEIL